MSKIHFNHVTSALWFIWKAHVTYYNCFGEVCEMVNLWNENMLTFFFPSCMVCLDKSMSIWHQQLTCPGWVFCLQKPHPFGNEYHTACFRLSGILFSMEMVEGKDLPPKLGAPEVDVKGGGKTGGLLLHLLKSIFYSGHYVYLDIGFCELKALIALKKKGVFSATLIKKCRFWPTLVPGTHILKYLTGCWCNRCNLWNVWWCKVQHFVYERARVCHDYHWWSAMFGGKEGSLPNLDWCKCKWPAKIDNFEVCKAFWLHFQYLHAVNVHNNLCHAVPSFEGTSITEQWPIQVFSFLLAVTKINTYFTICHFVYKSKAPKIVPKLLDFCNEFVWQMIENANVSTDEVVNDMEVSIDNCNSLNFATAPCHIHYFSGWTWILGAKQKYQQYKCKRSGCKEQTSHYCTCNPSVWLCSGCYIQHCLDAAGYN